MTTRPHGALLALLLFCACNSPSPTNKPQAGPPKRIASLAPNLTEITCDLDRCDSIIAVSDFDTYPPEVRDKPKLGGLLNPNLEEVVRQNPDLLLVHPSGTKTLDHANKMGLPTVAIGTNTLEEIYGAYAELGKTLGREELAAKKVGHMRSTLANLGHKKKPSPRVLMLVGRSPGTLNQMIAAGPDTYLGELLTLLGGQNIVPSAKNHWPEVSKELLVTENPDLIIELRTDYESKDDKEAWQQLPGLKAVKKDKVVVLRGEHLLIPGSRIIETAKALNGALAFTHTEMTPLGAPPQAGEASIQPQPTGWKRPTFSALRLNGKQGSLKATGQPMLVNLWASWCKPCRKEMPELAELESKYGPQGIAFVGITTDSEADLPAARKVLAEHKITYPNLADTTNRSESIFGVDVLPATFLFDAESKLVWSKVGPVHSGDTTLRQHLDRLSKK